MMILRYFLLMLLSPIVWAAEAELSADVSQAAQQLEEGCDESLREMRAQIASSGNTPAATITGVLTPEYCACISNKFRRSTSADDLLPSRQAELGQMVGSYAQDCAGERLKVSFPKICESWITEIIPDGSADQKALHAKGTATCNCMQHSIEGIENSALQNVAKITLLDYAVYKSAPDNFTASRPGSIFPAWRECIEKNK